METEKRLIDANALKELISRRSGNMQNDWSSPAVLLAVECQPTVDAEEVVRCKDCKHCEKWAKWNGGKYFACMRIPSEVHDVDPFHFCSYGERRCDNEVD